MIYEVGSLASYPSRYKNQLFQKKGEAKVQITPCQRWQILTICSITFVAENFLLSSRSRFIFKSPRRQHFCLSKAPVSVKTMCLMKSNLSGYLYKIPKQDWLRFRQINASKNTFDVAAKAVFVTTCNRTFNVTSNNATSL